MNIMSHKKHHGLKFVQGLGYVALSVGSAVATVVLATVTVALASTIIGIPLAIVTAVGTGACAVGTVAFAAEAGDKFGHAFGSDHHHEHHLTEVTSVSSHFDQTQKDQINQSSTALNNQNDINGSSKPFFAPVSPKHKRASNAPEMESVTSVINDDSIAKASV
jgi:hypothetical protein